MSTYHSAQVHGRRMVKLPHSHMTGSAGALLVEVHLLTVLYQGAPLLRRSQLQYSGVFGAHGHDGGHHVREVA